MSSLDPHRPLRRLIWAAALFLLAVAALIVLVARWYLLPAMEAVTEATPVQQRQLSAYSLLLLAIVLFIVIVGLILTFRISRFFFPRPPAAKSSTRYVDAWSESARRLDEQLDERDA